jgi:small-conductance mechanosensitive channel
MSNLNFLQAQNRQQLQGAFNEGNVYSQKSNAEKIRGATIRDSFSARDNNLFGAEDLPQMFSSRKNMQTFNKTLQNNALQNNVIKNENLAQNQPQNFKEFRANTDHDDFYANQQINNQQFNQQFNDQGFREINRNFKREIQDQGQPIKFAQSQFEVHASEKQTAFGAREQF